MRNNEIEIIQGVVVDDGLQIVFPDSERLDIYGPKAPPADAGKFVFTRSKETITRFNEAIPSQIFDKSAPTDWINEIISWAIMAVYATPIILFIVGVIIWFGINSVR